MKSALKIVAAAIVFAVAGVVAAHHMAAGIVDDDVYAMIDELVADTPHGDMTLTDLGGGMTEMVIFDVTIRDVETMVEEGLLTYGGMLDGESTVEISLATMRDVEVRILQVE